MTETWLIHDVSINPTQVVVFGMWLVAVLSASMVAMMWSTREQPGAVEMLNLLVGVIIWNAFGALGLSSETLSAAILWRQVTFVGICTVVPYTFFLGFTFSARDRRVPRWLKILMTIIPTLTIGVVVTNNSHSWMWSSITLDANGIADFDGGWWFWLWVIYAYLVLVSALVFFIRAVAVHHGVYRKQALIMLIALLIPWFANALFLLPLKGGLPDVDLTPLMLGISVMIIAVNYHAFHFLQSMPMAREKVMDSMNQGVLVMDDHMHILDANSTFCKITGVEQTSILDKDVFVVFPQYRVQFEKIFREGGDRHHELFFEGVGHLDIHISPLHRRESLHPGWIALIYNLSPRKLAQQQLREAHEQLQRKAAELEEAQDTIKSIGDLVPICAWCGKRIELEDGTWIDVEHFIEEHSHAELTHGLCPACASAHED